MRFITYMVPGFPRSLFEVIADVIGAELSVDETRSGPDAADDPFRDGRFDLGWICSTSYVDLAIRSADPTVQLAGVAWIPADPDRAAEPSYFGDLVVAADSAARTLDELRGARIGCNDPVSLSGHYSLLFELRDRGHEVDDFAHLVFTGGHQRSLDGVVAGELDAAIVDSVVRIGRARTDPGVAGLRIVERLGPWPVQPLVARSDLDPALVRTLADRLVDAATRPPLRDELDAAGLRGLVRVGADHYAPVGAAMDSLGPLRPAG